MSSLPQLVSVPSFTLDDVAYEVDSRTGDCKCGRRIRGNKPWCKHAQVIDDLSVATNPTQLLEHVERGLLADYRTAVLIFQSFETDYTKRVGGFEPGAWQHCLVHDGEGFICASWHIDYYIEILRDVLDVNTWNVHIPETHHRKEVKTLYRRPNYDYSTTPIKN